MKKFFYPRSINEQDLKLLIYSYLNKEIAIDTFIDQYIDQWRIIRDQYIRFDPKFHRILDRIFINCDCFEHQPENSWEIDEDVFCADLRLIAHIWWGF